MKLENQELITEFYERIRNDYPHLEFEQVKIIVSTPFLYLKQEMESGNLTTVRLKYFGTFFVYPKRAKGLLTKMTDMFKHHLITPQRYFNKKQIIENFLNRIDNVEENNDEEDDSVSTGEIEVSDMVQSFEEHITS